LRRDVRDWVDKNRTDGDTPYVFKQILAPQPSRTISILEEEESLASIGLLPSATLVLSPVGRYTSAYTPGNGLVSRGFTLLYGGASMVSGILGSIFGGTDLTSTTELPQNPPEPRQAQDRNQGSRPLNQNGTIRTLDDGGRQHNEGVELYNGNATNFEPREKDSASDE